jgi:hypothetical protein
MVDTNEQVLYFPEPNAIRKIDLLPGLLGTPAGVYGNPLGYGGGGGSPNNQVV